MTEEERIIATAQSASRLEDMIALEELALAAWIGECGRREQAARIAALQKAYHHMLKSLHKEPTP